MIPTLVTGFLIVVLYSSARNKGYNLLGELIVGIVIGFCWEMLLEPLFDYNEEIFSLFIFKDIPLAVVLGWGLCLMVASLVVDLLEVHKAIAIPVSAWAVGLGFELFGVFTGMWTYVQYGFLPLSVVFGWLFFGTIFLIVARELDNYIEEKINIKLQKI